ncbi:unnamed protein product [Phytophthora lilii]|uniref:Unnamed protein product n=1 Tax=Phytophthora lilii TaxID=2077276 RepID=A0A9W6WHZ7_9STRA|nr:unnamed protein product [Phytophthora lilii]
MQVKSFANAALKFDRVQLADVKSIPSTFEYSFDYKGYLRANVAYDLFTTSRLGGDAEYEIMIWLARLGYADPIWFTRISIMNTSIAGIDFSLYHGKNGNMTVYSYVVTNLTTSFSADLKQFIDELPANNSIAPTQYLTHVQAGTEPFRGNATLTVSKRAVTDASFRGKYSLLYFGFTHCPDICPNELVRIGDVLDKLEAEKCPEVVPLFVTVDPRRDTVEQMQAYKADFHPKFKMLTGTRDQVADITKAYRVYFSKADENEDDDDDYLVDHSIVMYLVGPDGEFLDFFTQNARVDDIAAKIKTYF